VTAPVVDGRGIEASLSIVGPMSAELAVVLTLLGAAIAMFAVNKPRMDAVALIMLVALPFTGVFARLLASVVPALPASGGTVLTMNEALAGFSDANIVLIAALFVIGEGLVRTGVARRLGDWLIAQAGTNEVVLIGLLMLVVCGLGATMSSTAVTAIFIPVALRVSQTTGTPAGRLMMPLSVAALISGMTTLIATAPNLVVSAELERNGHAGFGFFAFTPFGLPVLVLGVAYMIFARRWLGTGPGGATATGRPTLAGWVAEYGLAGREYRVGVTPQSPLVGQTVDQLRLRDTAGANLVAIERGGKLLQPTGNTALLAGDVLLLDLFAPQADIDTLRQKYHLEQLPLSGAYFTDRSQDIGMAEVILPSTSDLVGETVLSAEFRSRYGLTVIGLKHGTAASGPGLLERTLAVGDTLLLIGPWETIDALRSHNHDLVVINLPAEVDEVLPVPGKALQAVGVLLLVIAAMVSGVMPNVQAALIGCLLMGLLGIIDLPSAYRAIDWKTIVLIVGMLPFSLALQRTGGVDLMADGLMAAIGGAGTYAILAAIFALTALLGMFISNTATAVLMAPIALAVAKDLGHSPYPFAMIVALAASTAFMTPVSSPVNTLVVTPGNYTFGDFVKVGVPFSLVVLLVCVLLVPLLLPL